MSEVRSHPPGHALAESSAGPAARPGGHRPRRAFTLIEILVVTAIVAVLVGC